MEQAAGDRAAVALLAGEDRQRRRLGQPRGGEVVGCLIDVQADAADGGRHRCLPARHHSLLDEDAAHLAALDQHVVGPLDAGLQSGQFEDRLADGDGGPGGEDGRPAQRRRREQQDRQEDAAAGGTVQVRPC